MGFIQDRQLKEIIEGSFKSRVQHCLGNPNSNTMKSKENLINTSRNTKVGIRGEKNNWGWAVCLEDDCGIEREAERQQKEQEEMGNGMVKYGLCLTRTVQGSLTDSSNFFIQPWENNMCRCHEQVNVKMRLLSSNSGYCLHIWWKSEGLSAWISFVCQTIGMAFFLEPYFFAWLRNQSGNNAVRMEKGEIQIHFI